jgi:hypothetical protein
LGFRKALTSWLLIRENSKCFLLGAPGDEWAIICQEIWESEAKDTELLTNYDGVSAQTPFCSFVLARSVWVARLERFYCQSPSALTASLLRLPFSWSLCLFVWNGTQADKELVRAGVAINHSKDNRMRVSHLPPYPDSEVCFTFFLYSK